MNKLATLSMLFSLSRAETKPGEVALWNYDTWGADWPDVHVDGNKCGSTNQSPIYLRSNGWITLDPKEDNFNKIYTNQQGDIEIGWTGDTSKIKVNKPGQDLQTFNSLMAEIKYGAPQRFTGL